MKNKDQLLQDMGRSDSIFRKRKSRCRNNPESSEESEDEGSNINLILALKVVRKYAQESNMAKEVISLRNIEKSFILEKNSWKHQSRITAFFS